MKVCIWSKEPSLGLGLCVSVISVGMRVSSCITLSVLLEKFTFIVTHSRSEIGWSGLLKCLATGSPLLLSWILFCYC